MFRGVGYMIGGTMNLEIRSQDKNHGYASILLQLPSVDILKQGCESYSHQNCLLRDCKSLRFFYEFYICNEKVKHQFSQSYNIMDFCINYTIWVQVIDIPCYNMTIFFACFLSSSWSIVVTQLLPNLFEEVVSNETFLSQHVGPVDIGYLICNLTIHAFVLAIVHQQP